MTALSSESSRPSGVADYTESLKRDRDRFVALAFCAADLLLEVDGDGNVMFSAGATQSLIGKTPESLVGTPFFGLLADCCRDMVRELLGTMPLGERIEPVSVRLEGVGGPTVPLSLTGYYLPGMSGHYYLALRLAGSPVVAYPEEEPGRNVECDPESGLPDRDSFANIASQEIDEARRRGERLELTMVRTADLPELRARMDQESSASLMHTLGNFLQANSAGGKTAGRLDDNSYGFVHRSGIDIEKITRQVEEIFRAADPDGLGISVRSGTVDAEVGEIGSDDARRAILYTLNKFCENDGAHIKLESLSESLEELSRETETLLTQFRDATDNGNFEVAFQPIVSLETRKIHHFEALARIAGRLSDSPYRMITFAENAGIVHDFDLAMCRRVLETLSEPEFRRDTHRVAVNISGRSIVNRTFMAALHELLDEFDGVRSRLIFEVTESAKIEELQAANAFVQGLRRDGHHVCLDDFGAGSAALRYLHAFEMDFVKIDGAYIRTAESTPRNRAFLRAVIGMCRDLGIETIAEMVEEENTAAMLLNVGVGYAQGYLFGKPAFGIGGFVHQGEADMGEVIEVPNAGLRSKLVHGSRQLKASVGSPGAGRAIKE